MTKELIIAIITSSVVASIITGLLAPFVNWVIEKKRKQFENRKQLISEVRSILNREDFSRAVFRKSEVYSRIRPYISKGLDDQIRSTTINLVEKNVDGVDYSDFLREFVNKELSKIEKKWGLI
jgi:hypothetical protein